MGATTYISDSYHCLIVIRLKITNFEFSYQLLVLHYKKNQINASTRSTINTINAHPLQFLGNDPGFPETGYPYHHHSHLIPLPPRPFPILHKMCDINRVVYRYFRPVLALLSHFDFMVWVIPSI